MEDKIEIFIGFDREDVDFLRELKNHLKPMETQGLVTVWDATQIVGGTEWKQEITNHLKTASIILLLISANFMASPEGYNLAKQAVAKNAPPKVYVIPVLLREVDWEYSDLGKLEPFPSNRRPVGSWVDRNAAYADIVKGIRKIVAELKPPEPIRIRDRQPDIIATAEKNAEVHQRGTEEAVIASDHLKLFRLEDQPWYAPGFPRATEINQEQVGALSSEIDIVIITANNEELKAVMHKLEPYPRKRNILLAYIGPETYYLGKFGEFKAVVTKCRMGSAIDSGSVILAANQAQEVWRPRAIIMVGVAFGKDASRQKIGDVLVASQIIPYEGQRVGEQVIFRSPIPPSNAVLLNRFENALTWRFDRPDEHSCSLRVGPILSGEKLVDNAAFKSQLFEQFPQAIGGEMEGAGLCAASGRVGVAWILVKSICDWGDGTKQDLYQPLAAAAATSLVHHVLSQRTVLNSIKKY